MKHFLSFIIFITYSVTLNAQCNDLFFSEYIEGSGSNKAIEIYNPTSGPIDLSNYVVKKYTNGSTTAGTTITLSGTIASGDVYVITNSSASLAPIIAASDITSSVTNYNGDDAMELVNSVTGLSIDIIGVIGVDPGSSWAVGSGSTQNHTLIRKIGVNSGNTDWTTAVNEWDSYAIDMVDSIGMHTMTPCGASCNSTNSISPTTCATYTAPSGNIHTTSSVFLDTIPNAAGCDSIITINLTIHPIYNETSTASICSGDSYTFGTQTLTASGQYTETFSSINSCDSTVVLDLTVVASYTTNTTATICSGDSYTLGTQTLTMAGSYSELFTSTGGCDSTVNLVLTVNPTSTSSITETACVSYTSPSGNVWTTSNNYVDTIPNSLGCDSIISIALTINQPSSSSLNETACGSYDLNGTTYTSSGVFTQVIPNANGCDSTITLTLDITPMPSSPVASADSTYCEGDVMSNMTVQTTSSFDSLIISGVVDATLPGGLPKYIEFYAIHDIADLSNYGFGSANNGGGSDGVEYTFPAQSLTAGSYFTVATDSANVFTFFGFYPNANAGSAANVNGDDAIELFTNVSSQPTVIDVFGDINTDGSGEAWEYLDGWAYRNTNAAPNGGTFNIGEWSFSGPNALDGATDNASSGNPAPIQTYSFTLPTSSFTWYTDAALTNMFGTGNSIAPGASTQTYYVVETFTGSSTCTSSADMVTNTVNPLPNVTFGALTSICDDASPITLTEGSPANGTYSGTGVTTSPEFNPTIATAGTHTITYMFTDANGCSGSATSDIIVDACASLEDLFASKVQLFPNPANSQFALRFEQATATVTVLDLNGSVISTNEVVSNQKIDVSTLKAGIYLVQVSIDGHSFTKRLTVK